MFIDDKCKNCSDRRVGCHNVETCSFWAEHEKKKEEAYNERQKACKLSCIEITHREKRMRKYEHDHRR